MALIPGSNVNGLPVVTTAHLKDGDPSVINRVFRLLATQIQSVQTGKPSSTGITNQTTIVNDITAGGGGGSSTTTTPTVVTIQGTHANRVISTPAMGEPAGTLYYETDRTVVYLDFIGTGNLQVWKWISGTYNSVFSNRPSDLGVNDAGFLFYSTDVDLIYQWSGTSWSQYLTFEPVIQDVYSNWTLANYNPTTYAIGTLFVVSDLQIIYSVQLVSSVHKWVYVTGTVISATANIPTTGFNGAALGGNDTGLKFIASDTMTEKYWTGSNWVQIPSVPASALLLGSNSSNQIISASLTKGNIFTGNGSNVPTVLSPGANGKVLTANSSASNGIDYEAPISLTTTGTSGAASLTSGNPYVLNIPNYSSGGSSGTFSPTLSFGGTSTGITYSLQSGSYFTIGSIVIATIDITLSSAGSATGNAVLNGLPVMVSSAELIGGSVNYSSGMLLLSSPTCVPVVGTTSINLYNTGATGSTNLTNSNFTSTSRIIVQVIYGS